MPIYEYCCDSCGHKFEYLVFGSNDPKECLSCGGVSIRKLMSACGFLSKNNTGSNYSGSASQSCGGCTSTNCSGCT